MIPNEARFLYELADILGKYGASLVAALNPYVSRIRMRMDCPRSGIFAPQDYFMLALDGETCGYYGNDVRNAINRNPKAFVDLRAAKMEQMFWYELSELLNREHTMFTFIADSGANALNPAWAVRIEFTSRFPMQLSAFRVLAFPRLGAVECLARANGLVIAPREIPRWLRAQ